MMWRTLAISCVMHTILPMGIKSIEQSRPLFVERFLGECIALWKNEGQQLLNQGNIEHAKEKFIAAAVSGDSESQVMLAQIYMQNHATKDSVRLYRQAASRGYLAAQMALAALEESLPKEEWVPTPDYVKILGEIEIDAIGRDFSNSSSFVSDNSRKTKPVPCEKLLRESFIRILKNDAQKHMQGNSITEAFEKFITAALLHDPESQFIVANLYDKQGFNISALRFYSSAAQLGYTAAQFVLATKTGSSRPPSEVQYKGSSTSSTTQTHPTLPMKDNVSPNAVENGQDAYIICVPAELVISDFDHFDTLVNSGDVEEIKAQITAGMDIEKRDGQGCTALLRAAKKGYEQGVRILLSLGANVLARDGVLMTALHWAAFQGHHNSIRPLIEAKADLNTKDYEGRTPLHYAAMFGHKSCVNMLLALQAERDAKDYELRTALHMAAQSGHDECVRSLIVGETNVHAQADMLHYCSATALHFASANGYVECVKLLLSAGAQVNEMDDNGMTPLHKAAEKGHLSCIEYLISVNANVNAKKEIPLVDRFIYSVIMNESHHYYSPLYYAASRGHKACVLALLRAGARVDNDAKKSIENKWGIGSANGLVVEAKKSASSSNRLPATLSGASSEQNWLVEQFFSASRNGDEEKLRTLVALGVDVLTRYRDRTALHFAAESGHASCVKALLELGAELNAVNNSGDTAFHFAVLSKNRQCVKELIRGKALINLRNDEGLTPLHYAAHRGNELILQDLIGAGADVFAQDNGGLTSLHFAAQEGNEICIKLLLTAGSAIDAKTKKNRTALHYAACNRRESCFKLLKEAGADQDVKDYRGKTASMYLMSQDKIE